MDNRETVWNVQPAKENVIASGASPSKSLDQHSMQQMSRRQLSLKLRMKSRGIIHAGMRPISWQLQA